MSSNTVSSEKMGENFATINAQLSGLTSSVYLQSVSQVVPVFEGDPTKYKEWVKAIDKYATLTGLNDRDIPKIAFQTSKGPTSDYIKRYLNKVEQDGNLLSWLASKPLLTARFAELTDKHIAFAALIKIKQKNDESVQIYAERLLSVAEDAYPAGVEQNIVEHQLINIFIDGLIQDYLKFKVLRNDVKLSKQPLKVQLVK